MNTAQPILHHAETEQSLIALALKDNKQYFDLAKAEDFYIAENQLIWKAIGQLSLNQQSVDPVTISNTIARDTGKDLFDYLAQLYDMVIPAEHAETYAHAIAEHAYSRHSVTAADRMKIIATSMAPLETKRSSMLNIMENLESKVPETSHASTLKEAMLEKADFIEKTNSGEIKPVMTGFDDVDEITNGLLPGELIIVAARPSMGKTSYAMNIAENIANRDGTGTYVFSLEMRKAELAGRMVSSMADIDSRKMRTGNLTDREWERFAKAVDRAEVMNIHIDDRSALAVEEMRVTIRRHIRSQEAKAAVEGSNIKPMGLIIVDYIQIAKSIAVGNSSRFDMITEISGALKRIAKEFNVPLIALSQLSRDLERRADKRPIMADLRESGAIEQDADIIMFIYRDEFYHEDTPMPGKAEILIPKNRSGNVGVAILDFNGKFTRFSNPDNIEYTDEYEEKL